MLRDNDDFTSLRTRPEWTDLVMRAQTAAASRPQASVPPL
jgi:hypothetical protein